MTRMPLARRIVAVIAAALQLTLPLAAYARTPIQPGTGDICSVSRASHPDSGGAPAGQHATHCALCAHGAPPALPVSPRASAPVVAAVAIVPALAAFEIPQPSRERANARAPPRRATMPT